MFNTAATLAESGNEIICEKTVFESNNLAPTVNLSLRVVWNDERTIDNPNSASGKIEEVNAEISQLLLDT